MKSQLLIKNGLLVSSKQSKRQDILIENGVIKSHDANLANSEKTEIFDAKGCYVLPGGVDPHTHMELKAGIYTSSDDFKSGSIAAVTGGTTTFIDFVTPGRNEKLTEAFEKRQKTAKKSRCEYALHISASSWRKSLPDELKECRDKSGVASCKIYLAYHDSIGLEHEDIIKVMSAAAKLDMLVMAHCENEELITKSTLRLRENKKLHLKYYPKSRPPEAEALAIKNAISMAQKTNCKLYIVHVSSRLGVEELRNAKLAGINVLAETCPQHLLLNDELYEKGFRQALAAVIAPPLRKVSDNNALWEAMDEGLIQTVATDHCPFLKQNVNAKDFRSIPKGTPGVEERLALLHTFGVLKKKISLEKFVALCSENPAKIFGLHPRKGSLELGSDADIIIWDPNIKKELTLKTAKTNCDNYLYEGIEAIGAPRKIFLRGKPVDFLENAR